MLYHQSTVEGVWVIEIHLTPLVFREMAQVMVVAIVLQVSDQVGADQIDDRSSNRRFPEPVPPAMPKTTGRIN